MAQLVEAVDTLLGLIDAHFPESDDGKTVEPKPVPRLSSKGMELKKYRMDILVKALSRHTQEIVDSAKEINADIEYLHEDNAALRTIIDYQQEHIVDLVKENHRLHAKIDRLMKLNDADRIGK